MPTIAPSTVEANTPILVRPGRDEHHETPWSDDVLSIYDRTYLMLRERPGNAASITRWACDQLADLETGGAHGSTTAINELFEAGAHTELEAIGSDDDRDRLAALLIDGYPGPMEHLPTEMRAAVNDLLADVRAHPRLTLAPATGSSGELDDWDEVDLGPALRGEKERVQPSILRREDGRHLFYPGRVNGVHGDSGLGKSWTFLLAAKQEIEAGNHVVLVDFEEPDETSTVSRLQTLGLDADRIGARFHYLNPDSPASDEAVTKLCGVVARHAATLVGVDSIGEAFGLEGINEDKDVEVAPWMRRVPRRVADTTGAAVIIVDHGTKSADNPLYPSGSKRKRAVITGAAYVVTSTQAMTVDHGGSIDLTCAKDRHGNYRRGDKVAHIEATVYPDEGTTWHVWAPMEKTAETADSDLIIAAQSAVKAAEALGEPVSQDALASHMRARIRAAAKRAGIDYAVQRGALRESAGPRGSRLFAFIRPFREVAP